METYLGQIWIDGEWVDYARGTREIAWVWAICGDSTTRATRRRVVDWIDKNKVIFGEGADS